MQEQINRIPDYEEKNQRVEHPSAWLDEVIQGVELVLQDAFNEPTIESKNRAILATITYLSGILDGNRFMRENPYKNSPPPPLSELKKIHY